MVGVFVFNFFVSSPFLATEGLRFFSDELVLSGEDEDGEPISVVVYLARRESDDGFYYHNYDLDFYYDGEHREYKDAFRSASSAVDPDLKFFDAFENELFEDLSTRETYASEFDLEGRGVFVNVSGLVGDFITKNALEYTRYMSVGEAQVEIDGQMLELSAALEKIYSSDSSKYVYFDGFKELILNVNQFTIWDEDGNFYLIDNSEVFSDLEDYKSHSWVLYKDFEGNMQKFFEAEVEFHPGKESMWKVSLPDLDREITVMTDQVLNLKRNTGSVFGYMEYELVGADELVRKEVHGFFTHRWDKE